MCFCLYIILRVRFTYGFSNATAVGERVLMLIFTVGLACILTKRMDKSRICLNRGLYGSEKCPSEYSVEYPLVLDFSNIIFLLSRDITEYRFRGLT